MRWTALAVAAAMLPLLAGCLSSSRDDPAALRAIDACRAEPAVEHVLHFGPGQRLQAAPPEAGSAPGNAFSSAFLTNDLREWLSQPFAPGLWIVGNVTLDYWVRSTGTPAPLAIGGDPGQGYHFFNQFGSDRTFQPAYATEYSDVAPPAGAVDHYTETLQMPEGGFVVEPGDRVRVLLTDLTLDSPGSGGHDVLFGGDTPSQVRFHARCWPDLEWRPTATLLDVDVVLAANQGLLTGAVPAGSANQALFRVELPEGTERLTLTLRQADDANPAKDDVDMVLLDSAGNPVWSIGSPYSDESGTLWLDNLRAAFPDGVATVQVDSYSAAAYRGHLTVAAYSARVA